MARTLYTDGTGALYRVDPKRLARLDNQAELMNGRAADVLGITPRELGALVRDDRFDVAEDENGAPVLDGKALRDFVASLTPAEVRQAAPSATTERGAEKAKTDTAEGDADEAPVEGECPSCGAALEVSPWVKTLDCPQCGERVRVGEPELKPNPRRSIFARLISGGR